MKFRTQTHEEYMKELTARIAKLREQDSHKIAKILSRWEYERNWHSWFAWYPVNTDDGEFIWLQTVQRKLSNDEKPTIMATWDIRSYIYKEKI